MGIIFNARMAIRDLPKSDFTGTVVESMAHRNAWRFLLYLRPTLSQLPSRLNTINYFRQNLALYDVSSPDGGHLNSVISRRAKTSSHRSIMGVPGEWSLLPSALSSDLLIALSSSFAGSEPPFTNFCCQFSSKQILTVLCVHNTSRSDG